MQRKAPEFNLAMHLTTGGLMHLAMHVYSRSGYHIVAEKDDDDPIFWFQVKNPLGRVELVHCIQLHEPADLSVVETLEQAMQRANASIGFIWAPGGFSSGAWQSVQHKPIILADSRIIGHSVDLTRRRQRQGWRRKKTWLVKIFARGE